MTSSISGVIAVKRVGKGGVGKILLMKLRRFVVVQFQVFYYLVYSKEDL